LKPLGEVVPGTGSLKRKKVWISPDSGVVDIWRVLWNHFKWVNCLYINIF